MAFPNEANILRRTLTAFGSLVSSLRNRQWGLVREESGNYSADGYGRNNGSLIAKDDQGLIHEFWERNKVDSRITELINIAASDIAASSSGGLQVPWTSVGVEFAQYRESDGKFDSWTSTPSAAWGYSGNVEYAVDSFGNLLLRGYYLPPFNALNLVATDGLKIVRITNNIISSSFAGTMALSSYAPQVVTAIAAAGNSEPLWIWKGWFSFDGSNQLYFTTKDDSKAGADYRAVSGQAVHFTRVIVPKVAPVSGGSGGGGGDLTNYLKRDGTNSITGSILPSTDALFALGDGTYQFSFVHSKGFSGKGTEEIGTIFLGSDTNDAAGLVLTSTSFIQANAHIKPETDGNLVLGDADHQFRSLFTKDIQGRSAFGDGLIEFGPVGASEGLVLSGTRGVRVDEALFVTGSLQIDSANIYGVNTFRSSNVSEALKLDISDLLLLSGDGSPTGKGEFGLLAKDIDGERFSQVYGDATSLRLLHDSIVQLRAGTDLGDPSIRLQDGFGIQLAGLLSGVNPLAIISESATGYLQKGNIIDVALAKTGFDNPDGVDISYNYLTRVVTASGTGKLYYEGRVIHDLASGPITSVAHDATNGVWYWYYNGSSYVMSQTYWTFDKAQLALIRYNLATPTKSWALRECHGLMQWETHKEFHETFGCYKVSGGTMGGFVLASTTAADRRPSIAETVVADEDLRTTIPAWLDNGPYTQIYIGAAQVAEIVKAATDVVPVNGSIPRWNNTATGALVDCAVNQYTNVWLVGQPAASDANSQELRLWFLTGQSANTNRAIIDAETPASLTIGTISIINPEIVFLARVMVRYTAGNWTLISVNYLSGTKVQQVSGSTSFLTDAPIDGKTYARKDGAWLDLLGTNNTWLANQSFKSAGTDANAVLEVLNAAGTQKVRVNGDGSSVWSGLATIDRSGNWQGSNLILGSDTWAVNDGTPSDTRISINSTTNSRYTNNSSQTNIASRFWSRTSIANTNTVSGNAIGAQYFSFRGGMAGNSDLGTLDNLTALYLSMGHYAVAGDSPKTTNVYGLFINPYTDSGTITNLKGIYIPVVGGAGTITNKWGIHQEDTTAKNEFAGPFTLGQLAGSGTRLTTATDAGLLGNATTIAGAYTWSNGQSFLVSLSVTRATASSNLFSGTVSGESSARYYATIEGKQLWGLGAGTYDTYLERISAGVLGTTVAFSVGTYLEQSEQAAPATPASGKGRWYWGTDSKPHALSDAGIDYVLTTRQYQWSTSAAVTANTILEIDGVAWDVSASGHSVCSAVNIGTVRIACGSFTTSAGSNVSIQIRRIAQASLPLSGPIGTSSGDLMATATMTLPNTSSVKKYGYTACVTGLSGSLSVGDYIFAVVSAQGASQLTGLSATLLAG